MTSWNPLPFLPARGLNGGHLQTLAGHLLPRSMATVRDELHDVPSQDVTLRVRVQRAANANAPAVVMVHGLEGNANAHYLLGCANHALAAGFHVVRMNMRGCGDAEKPFPSMYHAGLFVDVQNVAQWAVDALGAPQVSLLGYSMGGNMVLGTAGLWGASPPSWAGSVAAVSPAVDLAASSQALLLPSNVLYEKMFLTSLMRRYLRLCRLFPKRFKASALARVRTLWGFDDHVVAPTFGFGDAATYYAQAASAPLLQHIHVPTLLLHAEDDPFIRLLPASRDAIRANPRLHLVATQSGGHCGFVAVGQGNSSRWAEQVAVDFLDKHRTQAHPTR